MDYTQTKEVLDDGTVGKVDSADIGDIVTVTLQDENGMPIEATGKVEEILEEYKY